MALPLRVGLQEQQQQQYASGASEQMIEISDSSDNSACVGLMAENVVETRMHAGLDTAPNQFVPQKHVLVHIEVCCLAYCSADKADDAALRTAVSHRLEALMRSHVSRLVCGTEWRVPADSAEGASLVRDYNPVVSICEAFLFDFSSSQSKYASAKRLFPHSNHIIDMREAVLAVHVYWLQDQPQSNMHDTFTPAHLSPSDNEDADDNEKVPERDVCSVNRTSPTFATCTTAPLGFHQLPRRKSLRASGLAQMHDQNHQLKFQKDSSCFKLNKSAAASAISVQSLPCRDFEGLWKTLVFSESLEYTLLDHTVTLLSLDAHNIDRRRLVRGKLVLLHGPPGSGKTSLCRALAQKLAIRMPYCVTVESVSSFNSFVMCEVRPNRVLSKYFSESGRHVETLFLEIARAASNCPDKLVVVLIDEVETLCASRQAGLAGHDPADAMRATNAVLRGTDMLASLSNVLLLATTNLPDALDAAFIDRVDLSLLVPAPSEQAAYAILAAAVRELARGGLLDDSETPVHSIAPPSAASVLAKFASVGNKSIEQEGSSNVSVALYSVASKCAAQGLSGRAVGRLPVLAYTDALATASVAAAFARTSFDAGTCTAESLGPTRWLQKAVPRLSVFAVLPCYLSLRFAKPSEDYERRVREFSARNKQGNDPSKESQKQLLGPDNLTLEQALKLMALENANSNRPVWDVRALDQTIYADNNKKK